MLELTLFKSPFPLQLRASYHSMEALLIFQVAMILENRPQAL